MLLLPAQLQAIGKRFVFSDRESAILSIGTAVGGSQLYLLNLLANTYNSGTTDSDVKYTMEKLTFATGGTAFICGILGTVGAINIDRNLAVAMFGYGLPALISVALPVIVNELASLPPPTPGPAA